MSVPKLIPYRAEHLLAFETRDVVTKEEIEWSVKKERWGPAFTAVDGDRILGSAGLILMWPGVGTPWMNLSEDIFKYRLWLHRTVKHFLSDYKRIYNLHRLEAVIIAGDKRNMDWIEALGFKPEPGTAHSYTTDKEDAVRYEWVRD